MHKAAAPAFPAEPHQLKIVVPLRKLFFAEIAQKWSLSEVRLQPLYQFFQHRFA
jgi:hypothetical protein